MRFRARTSLCGSYDKVGPLRASVKSAVTRHMGFGVERCVQRGRENDKGRWAICTASPECLSWIGAQRVFSAPVSASHMQRRSSAGLDAKAGRSAPPQPAQTVGLMRDSCQLSS